jgi:hypothetical protein
MNSTEKPTIPFEIVEAKLGETDDRLFWQTALSVLTDEFLQRCNDKATKRSCIVIGTCSHWVRPHNSCWKAGGGFAFPAGYRDSLPELDWSLTLVSRDNHWDPVDKLPGKRLMVFRVAIPTRTTRHKQAAIHTRWLPGEGTILYGFRNLDGKWHCVAASDEATRGRILAKAR